MEQGLQRDEEGRGAVTRAEARRNRAEQGPGRGWRGSHGPGQADVSEAMGQSGAQHQHLGRGMFIASRKRHESFGLPAKGRRRPRPA